MSDSVLPQQRKVGGATKLTSYNSVLHFGLFSCLVPQTCNNNSKVFKKLLHSPY